MIPVSCATVRRIATAALLLALAACDSGPKTYDDCMLHASRNSDSDRQFRTMAERCKAQFGHTLPFRAPPTEAPGGAEPPAKRP